MKATAAPTGIYSMTGFAQARVERDGSSVRINLRSVNHRFLDLHLRMPDGFEVFESRIRQAIRNRLRRGHVDVNVYYEAGGAGAVEVNHELVESYMKAVERLRAGIRREDRAGPGRALPASGRGRGAGSRRAICRARKSRRSWASKWKPAWSRR